MYGPSILVEPPSIGHKQANAELRAEAKQVVADRSRQCIRSKHVVSEAIWRTEVVVAYIVAQSSGPRVLAIGKVLSRVEALATAHAALLSPHGFRIHEPGFEIANYR
jgi:hypothetical protein